jgi:hypothetical protein
MHIWIVIAAFAFLAVTPFMGGPTRSDVAQMSDELSELQQAADDEDERAA